jgi:hypothetical protein
MLVSLAGLGAWGIGICRAIEAFPTHPVVSLLWVVAGYAVLFAALAALCAEDGQAQQ